MHEIFYVALDSPHDPTGGLFLGSSGWTGTEKIWEKASGSLLLEPEPNNKVKVNLETFCKTEVFKALIAVQDQEKNSCALKPSKHRGVTLLSWVDHGDKTAPVPASPISTMH